MTLNNEVFMKGDEFKNNFVKDGKLNTDIVLEFTHKIGCNIAQNQDYKYPNQIDFYESFLVCCIWYLFYTNTDMELSINSIMKLARLVDKESIYHMSDFDKMIYTIEIKKDCEYVKLEILHNHSIFNCLYYICYHQDFFLYYLKKALYDYKRFL